MSQSIIAKSYGTAAGLTLNGADFVGLSGTSDYGLTVADSKFYNLALYDRGTGASLPSSRSCCSLAINRFSITLPPAKSVAGADLLSVLLDGLTGKGTDTIRLTLPDGSTYSVKTLVSPGLAFLRLVATAPVASLTYTQTTSGEIPELNNFSFATRDTSASPAISSVVSATSIPGSVQPNIQAGSWAAIYGTNLAPAVQAARPTCTNVSPQQIDLQVPDVGAGPVQVIVTSNGTASAPFTAQART